MQDLLAANGVHLKFDEEQQLSSIICDRARHKSLLLGLTVFNLVWSAVALFLVLSNAPFIFKLIWPVTAVGLWFAIIWQSLHRRSASFGEDELTITCDIALWQWSRVIRKSEAADVTFDLSMQSGQMRYHRVRMQRIDKKKFTVVDGITEAQVAESVVDLVAHWMINTRVERH